MFSGVGLLSSNRGPDAFGRFVPRLLRENLVDHMLGLLPFSLRQPDIRDLFR